MIRKSLTIFGIVFLFLAFVSILGCIKLYAQESPVAEAMDFSLKGLDGKDVNLSDGLGTKPVLLSFGATWCPYCRDEVPQLAEIYNQYKDRALIYSIDIQESQEKVESFVKEMAINYPVLLDTNSKVASDYKVQGIPTVVVISTDKRIAYYGHDISEAKETLSGLLK